MSLADKYYLNGSIEAEFKGNSLRKVNEILFNMFYENKIKSGFLQREIYLKRMRRNQKAVEVFSCRLNVI